MARPTAYTGFTNLPNEILEKIARELYQYDWVDDFQFNDWESLFKTLNFLREMNATDRKINDPSHPSQLAGFARLDKHIYEVTAKILYEKVEVRTLNARPFLQTMLQNKKLASLVKEICFEFKFDHGRCWSDTSEGIPMWDFRYRGTPLTEPQKAIFAKCLKQGLPDFHFDGDDPTAFFKGRSPMAEAGLLLHALPNLICLQFGKDNTTTFDTIFRRYAGAANSHKEPDMAKTLFRQCTNGVFSKDKAVMPAAMLSLESVVYTTSGYKSGAAGSLWDIEAVRCKFSLLLSFC